MLYYIPKSYDIRKPTTWLLASKCNEQGKLNSKVYGPENLVFKPFALFGLIRKIGIKNLI